MTDFVEIDWKFREAKSIPELLILLKKYHSSMEKVCWLTVLKNQHFTTKIFDEYEKEIPWKNVAMFRDIPEKYLERYFDDIDKFEVSAFLPLSLTFIKKHYHMLSIDKLIDNDRLSKDAREYVNKLYNRVKDNPSYHKRWDNNLAENLVFCPKNFTGHYKDYDENTPFPTRERDSNKIKNNETQKQNIIETKVEVVTPKVEKKSTKKVKAPIEKYMGKSKAELKKILQKRKVRVFYHDTLDILRQKCLESEVQK